MHNRQTSKTLDLSFQDRYILAFERDNLPFNSHLILEMTGIVDFEKLKKAFNELIIRDPLTRIIPNSSTGRFLSLEIKDVFFEKQAFIMEQADLEDYWDKRFNFEDEIGIRLAYVNCSDSACKIILSFHHALFDGHAQFIFLQDLLTIYNGQTYQPRSLKEVYKFRKYFLRTDLFWYLSNLVKLCKISKRKGKTKIARLFDNEPTTRKVDMVLIELDRKIMDASSRKISLSISAYISLLGARAIDKILTERGDLINPIVLYVTKSMRSELKAPRSYQNLVGFIWMKIDREEFTEENFSKRFRDTYKFRSEESELKKTLLLGALVVKLKSFSNLKNFLKFKEEKIHDCSLLISSGRTPPEINFPEEWTIMKLYARGSMHRSPGIGLMVTSFKQKDFICIEYLKDSFKPETILRFKEILLQALQE
jgi:hypothetical protein